MMIRRFTATLHASDILIIAFLGVLSLINLAFASRIPSWWLMILINAVAVSALLVLGEARRRTGSKILRLIHEWYLAPAVLFSFKELYFMIKPIHLGRDYDALLIGIDRWIFGVDPTAWLMRFANPYLTEILQLAYTLFYFLFLVIGYELYRRRDPDGFHAFMFTCVYGFYLSYIGYLFLSAVGPRFTLHDFPSLDHELPGVLLTPYLRWFVNAGESVPLGVPNAVALAGAQRDVFPSGHTMMMLVMIYLSARFRLKVRYFIYVTGTLLIIATVYQRYHYVVDLIAGACFMVVCVLTAPALYEGIKRRFQTLETRFSHTP
jgi:membrane-associated phospholipid phosphatase